MGIPYYFYTLTKIYPNIVSHSLPLNPDIYCMDFNGVIHPICANETDEDQMIEKLYQKIITDITTLQPKKLILCIDGVVPLAKMIQQRKRRYLSVLRNKIDNVQIKWDTNAITPGTQFMKKLNTYLKKKFRYNTHDINIFFSGSDEYGEGEHKIFTQLQSEPQEHSVIIHGLDADLIILCLMSHKKNIYLLREASGNNNKHQHASHNTFLNIDNLRIAIIKELTKKWNIILQDPNDMYSKEAQDVIESYCVMCSLLGNDFIPHLLTLNLKADGLEKLITYTGISYRTNGLLVQNSVINYMALSDILQNIAKTEDKDIYTITEKYIKSSANHHTHARHATQAASEYYAIKNKDSLAEKIYTNIGKWRQHYYKHLFNTNIAIDSSVITSACQQYITGIYWTFAYYKKLHYDNTWYYPYEYPPTLRDIANYTLGNTSPIMEGKTVAYDTTIQLLIVLPVESKVLMEEKYQKYMEDIKHGLYHLYPRQYHIHTYLKTHLWECAPKLPIINIDYIKKITTI